MTLDLKIIRAKLSNPAHVRAVTRMLDQYAMDPMGIGKPLSAAIKKRLAVDLRRHKAVVFLAWIGKEAAGVAVCFKRYSTFSAAPILNIHDFAVLKNYRGKGVASAMLGAIEKQARTLHCRRITLEVRKDNVAARALYEKHGIEPGEAPYEYWVKELP